MKRRAMCLLLIFTLLAGISVTAAENTEYLFQTAVAITDETILGRVELILESSNIYCTGCSAVLSELDAAGQLLRWEENAEISLIGLEADVTQLGEEIWTDTLLGLGYADRNGITGEGVRVCMIDSGLRNDFAALTGTTVSGGVNFLAKEGTEERQNTTDNYGHGTAVATVIASVAPEAELFPLKCFESNTTKIDNIIQAVRYAVDVCECNVLNMSLGIRNDSWPLYEAVRYAFDNGVVVVSASGNLTDGASTGNDAEFYPAAWAEVISVGAVDRERQVLSLSVQNDTVTVVAPGQNLQTFAKSGTGTATWSGTSLAAPFAAGAAALAMSVDPSMKPLKFLDLLEETAEDLGEPGYDNAYGNGLLNIGLLLAILREDTESVVVTGSGDDYSVSAYVPKTKAGYQTVLVQYDADGRFLGMDTLAGSGRTLRNIPASDITANSTLFILEQGTWRPLHSEIRY